jgi:hypothetical protein
MGRYFLTGIPARACLMCCPHPAQVHLEQVLQVTFLHILTADSLLVHFLCSKYRSDDVTAMMLSQIMTLTSQLPQLSSLRNFYFHVKKASRLPEHTGCYATRPHTCTSSTTMLSAWPVEPRHIYSDNSRNTTTVTGVTGRCCGRSH